MLEYTYIVKVSKNGKMYEYSYSDEKRALNHYKTELNNGTDASMFRCKDGKMERLQLKAKCDCVMCSPKKVFQKILPISRAKRLLR